MLLLMNSKKVGFRKSLKAHIIFVNLYSLVVAWLGAAITALVAIV